ncbi:butyrate kinase [bacterium]|nr:butyrate kinase [bacterium]
MKNTEAVIVINPGSTSTKFALWSRQGCITEKVVRHDSDELAEKVADQIDYRKKLINQELEPLLGDAVYPPDGGLADKNVRPTHPIKIVGAVGRGGPLKPLKGGTYKVTDAMLEDLRSCKYSNHASNLGAMLAKRYATRFQVNAYVVDPITVDEFHDLARLSGVPWIKRKSRVHALNIKAVVRRVSSDLGKKVSESNYVVAHLGGGISIAPVKAGKIIDVNDALHGMGPYSPERAGALPIGPLIERCFSGETTKAELLGELGRNAGLHGYLGTSDVREILERIKNGDKEADYILKGMIYQTAKEIGAMTVVLHGEIDGIVLTGGLAHSEEVISMLKPYISFLGEVFVYPGEGELRALAEGAFRVIDGIEEALEY